MKKTKISKTLLVTSALALVMGLQIEGFRSQSSQLYSFPTSGTLRQKVDATCGGCHNNAHFTTAGGFSLATGASTHAGGAFSQSLSVDPTAMVGSDPFTSIIIQKPLEGSSMPHGGIKIPESHPTIQALMAWVQSGAPSAGLDYPVQPAPAYLGGANPVLVYAKSKAQPGGFRDIAGNGEILDSSVTDRDGDIWLLRYNAATNAVIDNTNLTNFPAGYNVRSPSPSLDASKIVFQFRAPGQAWRIGEINSDGTGFREVPLPSDSANYMQPVYLNYLPDGTPARSGEGGFVFLSDRANFLDEYVTGRTFSLYVCDANGGHLRQINFQPSHNLHPTMHSSGLVVYTDWQHNEHQGHNFMPIFAMCASDYESAGTNAFAAYGEHGTSPGNNSLHYASEMFTPGHSGEMLSQGSMRDDSGGSIVGPFNPIMTGTVGSAPVTNIIEMGDNFEPDRPKDSGDVVNLSSKTYRNPISMLDHYVVSKASPTSIIPVLQFDGTTKYILAFTHYWLTTFDLDGSNKMTNERVLMQDSNYSFYDSKPLIVRPTPPMIGKPIDLSQNTGVFTSGDVRSRQADGQPTNLTTGTNSASDITAIRFVRANQLAQGRVNTGRRNDRGIATQILGQAPVRDDGSVAVEVPADVPMQFQLVDRSGVVRVVHKPWLFVAPGETMRCVGCHADHNATPQVQTLLARQGPPDVLPSAQVEQFHFGRDIQPILNAKCVSCHDSALAGGAAGRSRALSLSGRMTPANVSEAYQYLIGGIGRDGGLGTAYVRTQNPAGSSLVWWLKGQRIDQTPPTAYPDPEPTVPHDQMLTPEELEKIVDWIATGINFRVADDKIQNRLNALSQARFSQDVWPIITQMCYSCHSTGGAGELAMSFDDGNAEDQAELDEFRMNQVAMRANFMIPEASLFLRKPLTHDLLNHGGGKLWNAQSAEYAAIYSWIVSGNPALAPGVPGTELHNVKAYPNPFRDKTTIVYGLSGAAASSVDIKIYSQSGKLIRELPGTVNSGGTTIGWNRVEWDGVDKNGTTIGNDVYFITVEAKFVDGVTKKLRQKCVKVR